MKELRVFVNSQFGAVRTLVQDGTVYFVGKDVAEALIEQTGLQIDRRKIELKHKVTAPGLYPAVAKLHPEISAQFNVEVTVAAE